MAVIQAGGAVSSCLLFPPSSSSSHLSLPFKITALELSHTSQPHLLHIGNENGEVYSVEVPSLATPDLIGADPLRLPNAGFSLIHTINSDFPQENDLPLVPRLSSSHSYWESG